VHVKGQKKKDKHQAMIYKRLQRKKRWDELTCSGRVAVFTALVVYIVLLLLKTRNGIHVLVKFVISNFCNVDTYGSESAGPEWEDCTWMDVGNVAYDLFAKSLKVCVNGIWKHVTIDVKGRIFNIKSSTDI
jgi:hypothetical protein